jgi:hypothetical protein
VWATLPRMKSRPDISDLSPTERKRKISVAEAAEFNDVHEDTFRRNFPHLIRRIGKRRQAVELGDAIALPPPED